MPTTFANTIDGNEILAKRSQCDYAGNDIQTTYATKSELPTATSDITNDSGYITLSDVPAQVNADWNASSGVSEILNKPTIPSGSQLVPAATIADADKVLKVNSIGTPEWSTGGGGGGSQVNSDWDATSGVAEILNKPTPKTLTAGANISISEGVGTLTISSAAGLPASTSADEGKCLVVDSNGDPEWGTGGKTYTGTDGVVVDNVNDTVGLESPVDLVAGPGITVDNPDGNTVRISLASTPYNETVLWNQPTFSSNLSGSVNLSETVKNFSKLMITFVIETTSYSYPTPTTKVFDMEALAALNNYTVTLDTQFIASDNNLICRSSKVTMNGTTFSETMSKQWYSGGVSTMSNPLHIIRVVGINRIANN